MQSNIILVVVLLLAALVSFSGPRQSRSLVLALGCATTYIVTTGVVYNVLLAGLEGGVSLAWANTVLHVALPVYAALDWVIVNDRGSLPRNKIWISLIYPIVWIIVVIIRGATDGWVPYDVEPNRQKSIRTLLNESIESFQLPCGACEAVAAP
jgi:hypothetical protein